MTILSNKEIYRSLCKTEETIQIFIQDWWLDAVCGEENWNVLLSYTKDGSVKGSLCFYVKEKMGLKYITQPKFSQNTGLWLNYPPGLSHEKKLSFEKETCYDLITKLEEYAKANCIVFYQQAFDTRYTNWLPFYWKGYQQTTAYTYRIENISDIEIVYDNFNYSKKKNIKKANKLVKITYDLPSETFYEHHKTSLKKQNDKISYSFELFSRMYDAVYKHNQGKVICCKDQENNIHVALFVIWDKIAAYDLISTIDPDFRNSGASSLAIFEIIKYLKDTVHTFDFEGSMIEEIENSFRKFGTIQTPYLCINKIMTNNKLIKYILGKKINGR